MKNCITNLVLLLVICYLMLGCVFGNTNYGPLYSEIRTGLSGTNIIGIAGEHSDDPYIEIIYSVADLANEGKNKTESIKVSPPYVFKNNSVYITYDYVEYGVTAPQKGKPEQYSKFLRRNFEEGGAEYLRIINHSPVHDVEFFVSGHKGRSIAPEIWYRNAPIYYLLYLEQKP